MNIKKIILPLVVLSAAIVLAACSPKEEKNGSSTSNSNKMTKINIGTMAAPDSAPLYVAYHKGYFKDEGIDAKLTLFKDPNKRDAAAGAGQIDASVVDFTSFTSYMRSKNKDWKLITQLTGRFGVAVPKDSKIKTIKDLKGKKVANSVHQVTTYYMYTLLKQNGMSQKDIKQVNVPQIPQRVEMIKNNQAAATVLPQTFLTLAKVQGCRVLTVSKPSFQPTALAAKGVLLKNKTVRTRFLRAYNKAVKDLNKHPKVLQTVLAKDLTMPKPVVALAPKEFPKYNDAKTPNLKTFKDILNYANDEGFFTKKVNPVDYVVPVN